MNNEYKDISKKDIIKLAKKKEKNIFETEIVCNHCVWAYGDDECVSDKDCKIELTEFKPNWIWKIVKTPTKANIIDINGNTKEIEYPIFTLKKI